MSALYILLISIIFLLVALIVFILVKTNSTLKILAPLGQITTNIVEAFKKKL